ncbi:quercetin 2,3-dioxygenase [Bacillus zhangzhouensis]|uniref:Dioxygenase n=1 Tax=Bacillus zhangzhouensis TaxID=1178540 RepID=A0A081LBX9_9BACI|nr:quercetin 2,3-dioxygenase [Bacillus zhangzhouensis]KEP26755.1 dioxygenase [Bacillus zhangzhouensis]
MSEQPQSIKQSEGTPFYTVSGSGKLYGMENQLVHVLAEANQTNKLFELVLITGGKGAYFPLHCHETLFETIFVLEGKLEVMLDGKKYMVTACDYIHIPPKTIHGYRMHSHKTRFISYTLGGQMTDIYQQIGKRLFQNKWPMTDLIFDADCFQQVEKESDIMLMHGIRELSSTTKPSVLFHSQLPHSVQPYVLEAGEGKQYIIDGQLHELIATTETTGGGFSHLVIEGTKGKYFPPHYHQVHTEALYCVEGKMNLHLNGEDICLMPGDFAYIPPDTIHSYELVSHSNKFLTLLLPGDIEQVYEQFEESQSPCMCPYFIHEGNLMIDRETSAQYDLVFVEKE